MTNKKLRRREARAQERQPKKAAKKAAPKHAKTEETEGRRTGDG